MEDPGKVWDSIVESAMTKAKQSEGSPPERFGVAKVHLLPEPKLVHRQNLRRAVDQIQPYLRGTLRSLVTGDQPWPLFMTGAAGRGKTCAALCLLDYTGGEYLTAAELCEIANLSREGRYMQRAESGSVTVYPQQFWRWIASRPLFVLDEIGLRENASDHQYETLQRFLEARTGLPTIFISNISTTALRRVYDDRIVSRISRGTVADVQGEDRRA